MKYQEDVFNATKTDSAFNVDCVRVHREAVTADSIVRDNIYPRNSGRRSFNNDSDVYMAPEYNPLQDSTSDSSVYELPHGDLAQSFTQLFEDNAVDRLIENVAATNEFVALECATAKTPETTMSTGRIRSSQSLSLGTIRSSQAQE